MKNESSRDHDLPFDRQMTEFSIFDSYDHRSKLYDFHLVVNERSQLRQPTMGSNQSQTLLKRPPGLRARRLGRTNQIGRLAENIITSDIAIESTLLTSRNPLA